jgi:hypothetical protein
MNRTFRITMGLTIAICFLASTLSLVAQNVSSDPLVQVLVSKGVLTKAEAGSISGTPAEQRDRLAKLLVDKGVITPAEYSTMASSAATLKPAVSTQTTTTTTTTTTQTAPAKPPAPTVIPAVAPVRVLQFEPSKPGGLIPDIKLGSGAKLKLYGFLKATAAYDSSSPYGNDFPLPGFNAVDTGITGFDIGPDKSPEFHMKARSSRIGGNFEWPDVANDISLTGKVEADFEGNFNRSNNRNISSIRSNQFNLRLAWGRVDWKPSDKTSFFFLGGQDWSPFGSSILPNTLETTGVQIGFGSLYTREPQFRVGFNHDFGGSSHFSFGPEFAITLPAYGDLPPFLGSQAIICTSTAGGVTTASTALGPCITSGSGISLRTGPGNLGDQLGYGEREGTDASKPGIEGRLVFQWQADHAKGVPPAQIVGSGMWGAREAVVPRSLITSFSPSSVISTDILAAFPHGATMTSNRWGGAVGISLPTRWATLTSQYYRGTDLRWYFAGQIYTEFNNTAGLTALPGTTFAATAIPSIDGSTSVEFARNAAGQVVVVPQTPARTQGGFVELGLPLSKYFNAEPSGRMAGFTMNLHYGIDDVFKNDVVRLAPAGGRGIGDVGFVNLFYKMNQYLTWAIEESYYRTRAIAGPEHSAASPFGLPLVSGIPSNQWHDVRTEAGTIFTF